MQCPNSFCQALNPESQEFCHSCQTRIPKRYLWAVGLSGQPGALIGDRFVIKSSQIVLDTKPGTPVDAIEVPPHLEPYLHLMEERPTIPQPYAVVETIVLLESAPINSVGKLMPTLTQVWTASAGFRQLHFLQQLSKLWQRLSIEKVTSTLLNSSLIFAEVDTIRLLELQFDQQAPTLADLGELWATWQPQPEIAEFFDQICQNLIQGQITAVEPLIDVLNQAIATQAQYQTQHIQIATATDQGPIRHSNEDACYPPSGTKANTNLVIVCDGIGGHEGGEVASNLAIQIIAQQVQALQSDDIEQELEAAVCAANDAISQKNDAERREERQRMGTTVVMGLVRGHQLYLAHVGDSRAYRITRQGCYQVTLDDDVASREARLGYSLYRDALQHPSAGSLVQALGMGSSSYLRPTVQRFILDEECVFLLCSDGLSDNDRVEEVWQSEIVPILDSKADVARVAHRLIEIANTRNGHDNVTVGLIHCQTRKASGSKNLQLIAPNLAQPTRIAAPQSSSQLRTEILEPRRINWLKVGLILLALFGLAGAIATLVAPELVARLTHQPSNLAPSIPPVPASPEPTVLSINSFISLASEQGQPSLPLFKRGEQPAGAVRELAGQMPPGTVLRIVERKPATQTQPVWVKVQVCKVGTPTGTKAPTPPVTVNMIGWQQESAIAVSTPVDPKSDQTKGCTAPTEAAKENPPSTP